MDRNQQRQINEQLDDLVDAWHDGAGDGQELYEFLGMNFNQYAAWVSHGELPEGYKIPDTKETSDGRTG